MPEVLHTLWHSFLVPWTTFVPYDDTFRQVLGDVSAQRYMGTLHVEKETISDSLRLFKSPHVDTNHVVLIDWSAFSRVVRTVNLRVCLGAIAYRHKSPSFQAGQVRESQPAASR